MGSQWYSGTGTAQGINTKIKLQAKILTPESGAVTVPLSYLLQLPIIFVLLI